MRHGTTTLFAALNVLDGTRASAAAWQRHRHQEFIRFLNADRGAVPAGKVIHAILDNYASPQASQGPRLARPASALDLPLHADLGLLAERRRDLLLGADPPPPQPRRFHSIVDLQAAINRYIAEHNDDPKPFTWTKPADPILAKLNPLNASVH